MGGVDAHEKDKDPDQDLDPTGPQGRYQADPWWVFVLSEPWGDVLFGFREPLSPLYSLLLALVRARG